MHICHIETQTNHVRKERLWELLDINIQNVKKKIPQPLLISLCYVCGGGGDVDRNIFFL